MRFSIALHNMQVWQWTGYPEISIGQTRLGARSGLVVWMGAYRLFW